MDNILSIYHDIEASFSVMPYYPYLFQGNDDGILEASIVIYPHEMSQNKKYTLANELFMYFQDSIELNKPTRELIEMLSRFALLNYAKEFMELVRFNANKDEKYRSLYAKVGYTLATMMSYKDLVKLGVLLLGLEENERNEAILRTLGAHSEYTAYAIEALRYSYKRNDFVRELLGKSADYGRVIALSYYVVMDYDSAIYLMEHAKNDRLPCYASYAILDKIVRAEYFERLTLTKYNYSKYAYLVAHALIDRNLKDFPHVMPLLRKMIKSGKELITSLMDYLAILVIKECLENEQEETNLIEECTLLLSNPDFKTFVMENMEEYTGKAELLIQAASYLNIVLPDVTLLSLFPQSMIASSDYMFREHAGEYEEFAAKALLPLIQSRVSSNIERKDKQYCAEEYFLSLLLEHSQTEYLEVVALALSADNRLLRQNALEIIMGCPKLENAIISMLEERLPKEPSAKLRKQIQCLLDRSEERKD